MDNDDLFDIIEPSEEQKDNKSDSEGDFVQDDSFVNSLDFVNGFSDATDSEIDKLLDNDGLISNDSTSVTSNTGDNDIQDINKNVTRVNIDNKTIGDKIYANVNVEKDGYFVTTIPYDKGFTIKVDNNKIDYEIVNKAFVGFKINKGYHNVEISYRSPGKLIGIIFSSIGIVIYLIIRKGKQIVNIV